VDVFLVPIGGVRYELYCEVPDDVPEPDAEAPRGAFAFLHDFRHRLSVKFHQVVAEAERERRMARAERPRRGWLGRLRGRAMRWVAESIAEQRLLWHLRRQSDACLLHPDDVEATAAIGIMRKQLGRDFDKHQFWLIFDSLGLIVSFILVPIPGPNPFFYYFAFRVVGHYLSLRGARQGLNATTWRTEPRAPLTELRRAIALDPVSRERHVNDIALRLRLEHLATFFLRTAIT
jgi:Mitochondrial K+-H+ exchange-related